MSEAEAPPPIVLPQITHTPSEKPPPSPISTSSSCSSTATEDISDSGEDLPATMEPSEFDYLTHGDLRSPGREFARERSLRKKAPHRLASSNTVQSPPVHPGVQPTYPSDDDEDKRKILSPEERSKARKKAKKAAKAEKKKALKSQESVKNPRKREDRRREDDLAEAEIAALKIQEQPEVEQTEETADTTNTIDRQRRRSSNALARPAKPRKTSSSNQGGSGGGATIKSPKIGTEADETPGTNLGKRGNAKHVAAFTQYHVEEGMHVHERSGDIDFQMAALAKLEQLNERSRGGKLARGLEELEKRKMERKRDEALKGVVDTAQERYEDEKLARLYGLK
ncbi:hypothetical protein TWF225_001785 [Orbilia oligospora]|nr:hypothetical protein TWF225_001785 [Orbilia oligospora]KAF3255736.1 hypothetical protein TWF217_006553 [Orbilia oligospora]KAF3265163.1 hypothetical protein TWF128_000456 [Orbilia oligospora]